MDRYGLAWAAGFFDGEGWAARIRDGSRATRRPMARINQAGVDGPPDTLERFRRALGDLGAIGGPDRISGRKDLYRWVASSEADVTLLFELLSPWVGPVKLGQLAAAAQRSIKAGQIDLTDDAWCAWAAGLYDGEGCSALLHHRTHPGYMIPELSLTQSSRVGAPAVLVRFSAIVKAGSLSGPYRQRNATMDVYRWKASARADVQRVIAQLWPFLSGAKRSQAQRLLDTLAAQPDLPRGNPAWGNNKTHCVNGHEYATARMRPFVPRKGGEPPRENSSCLACLREHARRQREAKNRPAVDDDHRSISEPATSYLLK